MALLFTHRLRTCPGIFLFFSMIPFTTFWLMPILWSLFAPFAVELSVKSWTLSEEDPWMCPRALMSCESRMRLCRNQSSEEAELGSNLAVQEPWLLPPWFLCGMAECRTSDRKVEETERNQSKWSEIIPTTQAKASGARGAGGRGCVLLLLRDLGGDIAQIPGRSFTQVCSFRLCLLPCALHCGGWRKQAYKNTRKNTLECTVSLRAFGIRSAVAFEPALWYDEIS